MLKSQFVVKEWHEEFVHQDLLAKASAIYQVSGQMEGEIHVEYGIYYLNYDEDDSHKSQSVYNGFMFFDGRIGEQSGTFIMEDRGSFIDQVYQAKLEIVQNSGTKDFMTISGSGTYFPVGEGMMLELELELERV